MNHFPTLASVSQEDVLRTLAQRAADYVPEWRFDRSDPDAGAALAVLFAEMFAQTCDRYNSVPQKYYTEFLNLLGACENAPQPASGYIRFLSSGGSVGIPEGTEVYAASPTEENVIFSTVSGIEAVSASLTDVYCAACAGETGFIKRLDLSRIQPFFSDVDGESLKRHRFRISQNDVFSVRTAADFILEIRLQQSARFLETETTALLADSDKFRWLYRAGEKTYPFDKVSSEGSRIFLTKSIACPLTPEDDGNLYLYCESDRELAEEIVLDAVSVSSRPAAKIFPDACAAYGTPILPEEGGYCFGQRPVPNELFYIRADDVFSKRGARVSLALDMRTVTYSDYDESQPLYQFNKTIIDKQSLEPVVPDDIFIENVVWEYANGSGWAPLRVDGDKNPFSCRRDGNHELTFTVPADMAAITVNAVSGLHIRARAVSIQNFYSAAGRHLLPFVRGVSFDYEYPAPVPVNAVCAENNGVHVSIPAAAAVTSLQVPVYRPMPPQPPAMYLRFDRSPHAMPLSLLFELCGASVLPGKVTYECQTRQHKFESVRCIDYTDNLLYTGAVLLYLPEPLERTS